jgi:hypothetical protein
MGWSPQVLSRGEWSAFGEIINAAATNAGRQEGVAMTSRKARSSVPMGRMVAAVAGAFSLGAAAWAADTAPSAGVSDSKIRELEAKVAALEAKQNQSQSDMTATIDSVLRDAEQRSKLLATSGNAEAGYDNGFFIRQGDFELRPTVWMQFRNVLNYREDTSGPKSDEFDQGFEIRRARLDLQGHAFANNIQYQFQWEANREGGGVSLLDAWAKWNLNNDWAVRVGQFKDPLTHEKLVSASRQLAADRTMLDNILGGSLYDRVQGVTVIYGGADPAKSNPLNVEFGLTDGGPSKNTNFTKHGFDFGLVARAEYKVMGDWRDYRDFTAKGTTKDLLVVGGAMDWSQAGDANLVLGTVDAQWENTAGLGVYGAILIGYRDDAFTGSDNSTDFGILVQAGYMLNKSWEIFGRVDLTKFDEDIAFAGGDTEDTFYEITLGANYYLGPDGSYGHRAKFTFDLTFLPNGAPSALDGIGVLDANDGGTEIVFRSQFQLMI